MSSSLRMRCQDEESTKSWRAFLVEHVAAKVSRYKPSRSSVNVVQLFIP